MEVQPSRPDPGPPSQRHRHRGWLWLLLLAAVGIAGWHFRPAGALDPSAPAARGNGPGNGRGGARGGGAAVPVQAATAVRGNIPVYLRGIGNVSPANTVTLRTRVDGQITAVHFQEGQMVRQGELLVEIDSRPFQAALAQVQGQLAHDTALYNNDLIDEQRYQTLYQQNIISRQQLDSQSALVNEYKGAMASDQAAIDTAKLNLAYARIAAPISGRIGFRQVDPGNVVHASDQSGLAVITQVQPIAVLFSLPQVDLPQVMAELQAGRHPEVDVWDSANTQQLAAGRLLTIDNSIDPSTGTFRCKAMFDNTNNALFPNQFVNARLRLGTASNLTVVPPAAVQQGPQGTYVYVISPENQVSVRAVTVQLTEGQQVGLASGVQPGERVVIDGADKLQEGSRVDIPDASAGAAGGHGASPSGGHHRGGGPGGAARAKRGPAAGGAG